MENAILEGRVEKKMTQDVRGTRYRIEGPAIIEEVTTTIVIRTNDLAEIDRLGNVVISVSTDGATDKRMSTDETTDKRITDRRE